MILNYRLIILTVCLSLSYGCGSSSPDNPAPTFTLSPSPERITFSGTGTLGIFDPSITRDPATGRLWMSFSSIDNSSYYLNLPS